MENHNTPQADCRHCGSVADDGKCYETMDGVHEPEASTAHTPGPWRIDDHSHAPYRVLITAGSKDVAHLYPLNPKDGRVKIADMPEGSKEDVANARLIAAAPELFRAAKELLLAAELNQESLEEHTRSSIEGMKAAIALAA